MSALNPVRPRRCAASLLAVRAACHDGGVDLDETVSVLRSAGARFAFVFGSRARGDHRPDSDIDVAAFFGSNPPASFEVLVPHGIDLLVLDSAPLELAGRVSLEGVALFDDAPEERVVWLARTRKIYSDERYRFERSHREFAEAVAARG